MSEFARPSKDGEPGERASGSPLLPWIWPLISAATISGIAAAGFGTMAKALAEGDRVESQTSRELDWATAHRLALELPCMRLRDFSQS